MKSDPVFRTCWLYTVEVIIGPPRNIVLGVRVVEHAGMTTAKPDDKESKFACVWRTDERIVDDEELRQWVLDSAIHGAATGDFIRSYFEVVRSPKIVNDGGTPSDPPASSGERQL